MRNQTGTSFHVRCTSITAALAYVAEFEKGRTAHFQLTQSNLSSS